VTRFGPLDVRNGTLVLGDDGGHHAVLTPSALVLRPFEEQERPIEWTSIRTATASFPQTRLRWPGLLTTVGIGTLAALLGDWGVGSDPRDGHLDLTLRDGQAVKVPLTCHHVVGTGSRASAPHPLCSRASSTPPNPATCSAIRNDSSPSSAGRGEPSSRQRKLTARAGVNYG